MLADTYEWIEHSAQQALIENVALLVIYGVDGKLVSGKTVSVTTLGRSFQRVEIF